MPYLEDKHIKQNKHNLENRGTLENKHKLWNKHAKPPHNYKKGRPPTPPVTKQPQMPKTNKKRSHQEDQPKSRTLLKGRDYQTHPKTGPDLNHRTARILRLRE